MFDTISHLIFLAVKFDFLFVLLCHGLLILYEKHSLEFFTLVEKLD